MFIIPGFDPKTLTNDQLFDKQLELTRRKLLAARFGQADGAQQIQNMIQAIEIERTERMFNDRIGNYMRNSSPVVIETDPVLRAKEMAIEEAEQPKPEKSTRPIRKPIRSDKPVKPTENGGAL